MSNSIIVQSIEGFSTLQGEINYTPPTTTDPVVNLVVIGDDNSGSMQSTLWFYYPLNKVYIQIQSFQLVWQKTRFCFNSATISWLT